MLNNTLINYIRDSLNQGYDANTIYKYLLKLGWNSKDLQDSFYFVDREIRMRQMQQQQLRNMQQKMMQPQMQITRPMQEPEPTSMANFVIPIIGVFLILIIGSGIFFFINLEKTTVGAPTGIQPEEKMSPPRKIELRCGPCQYIANNRCLNFNCCSNANCNDDNPNTEDVCENPSTANSICINAQLSQEPKSIEPLPEPPAAPTANQEPTTENQPIFSCLDQFGIECLEGETCPGEILPASDTDKCCSIVCE